MSAAPPRSPRMHASSQALSSSAGCKRKATPAANAKRNAAKRRRAGVKAAEAGASAAAAAAEAEADAGAGEALSGSDGDAGDAFSDGDISEASATYSRPLQQAHGDRERRPLWELPEAQARVRHAILAWSEHAEQLDSPTLIAHLTSSGLGDEVARITSSQPLPLSAPALVDAMPAEAEAAWWHYFGQLNLSELEREVEAAATALRESITEATSRRMITLKVALNRLRSGEQGEEPGL